MVGTRRSVNDARAKRQPAAKRRPPFSVTLAEKEAMNSQQLVLLYELVVEEHGELIGAHLANSRYGVLCNGKVVYSSRHEPSDEEVIELEKKFGKICYVLTKDPVEESSWSSIAEGNYYPNIEILLGDVKWTGREVFERGLGEPQKNSQRKCSLLENKIL